MSENSTIHERIKILIEEKAGGKNTSFAQKLGVNEANIRGYIKNVLPKADILEKIVRTYDIDAMWLLTGAGAHTPSESSQNNFHSDVVPFLEYMREKDNKILKQAEELVLLKEKIKNLEISLGKKDGTSDILRDFLEEVTSAQNGAEKVG